MIIDTPFLQHVAVSTVLIIAFAFILGIIKSQEKKSQQSVPSAVWDVSSYYMYLRALIVSSLTLEQLYASQPLMKGFLKNSFREPVSEKIRQRYYLRILEVYCVKEKELTLYQLPRNATRLVNVHPAK